MEIDESRRSRALLESERAAECSCGPDWNVPLWGHWYACPVARQASAPIARIEQAADQDREDARKRRGRVGGQLVDGDAAADERGQSGAKR